MNRKQRTRILVRDESGLSSILSRQIEKNYEITVVEKPHLCLVMAKVRESVNKSLFYLGEVLASEARVQIDGTLGFGIVEGDNKQKALELAIIDAAINLELDETKNWDSLLIDVQKAVDKNISKEFVVVEKSRVKFNIMEEYFNGVGKKS